MQAQGWKIRLASDVASRPDDYRSYVQNSRGEFSCAKPSCMKFQNAWVSDRSLCYLASGKPVIVQNTGPSEFLPDAEGMFRFNTVDDALSAIDTMNSDYKRHCSAARELAATYFDAEKVLASVLDLAV
jgi:glycosyltransferase involved in cell wall biosynthesis